MCRRSPAAATVNFYPRPPRGGRLGGDVILNQRRTISIHALREEGDSCPVSSRTSAFSYFYPRPPRGGRPKAACGDPDTVAISIHALREEGDILRLTAPTLVNLFLSTPSARRATWNPRWWKTPLNLFLSTPSARRATKCSWMPWPNWKNFYPRPPRGGRPVGSLGGGFQALYFYPRPPRGGRPLFTRRTSADADFYPRPPRGGRLPPDRLCWRSHDISIHALREEGDQFSH